jgi:hypothetical protein
MINGAEVDDENKPASLDDVIKTCESLHVEEQQGSTSNPNFKYYSKNMNISSMEH